MMIARFDVIKTLVSLYIVDSLCHANLCTVYIYIIVCIDNLLTSRYNGFISANQYNGQHDGAIGTHQEHAHRGAHIVQLEFAKGA